MNVLSIPAGTQIFLGAPAKPIGAEVTAAIGALVDSLPGVTEAHLPQCFALGVMEAPAQILAVVVATSASTTEVIADLCIGLERILPAQTTIDIWPLRPDSDALIDIRSARCPIGKAAEPWWKFWK